MTQSMQPQERLLTLREVISMTSLSRPTIYREIAACRFPSPVKIGRMSRWPYSDVTGYVDGLKYARDDASDVGRPNARAGA